MLFTLWQTKMSNRPLTVRPLAALLKALVSVVVAAPVIAVEPPQPTAPTSRATIHLANGGFAPGELKQSGRRNILRWQADAFVAPFEFGLPAVNAIHFPVPTKLPRPDGEYCFELAGGDVLFGTLAALDDKDAILDVPRMGRLSIQRASINRMYRWKSGGDLVYLGPNGLDGWHQASPGKSWKEEQGQPWTDQDGAMIRGDLQIPARSTVEFEISWKTKPDFVLALGVGEDEKTLQRAFRFEIWERDLIVQRETEQEADVASVGEIASGPGRIHLIAYLDQEKGRILVFSPEGKPLADLKVASNQPLTLGSLSLINKRGDVRLERLRVGRWGGEPPRQVEADRSRIHRVDGSIAYGLVARFDPVAKSFVVGGSKDQTQIPEREIAVVFLSRPRDVKDRGLAAVYQDGSRLSGELEEVEQDTFRIAVPGIKGAITLPIAGLRSLVALHPQTVPSAIGGMAGVLDLEDLRLPGRLLEGKERPGSSCLVWQPQGSSVPSSLRPGVSGRIVYKETRAPTPVARRPAPPPQGPGGFVVGFLSALGGNPSAQPSDKRKMLHLRSGDTIPADVTAIDETGVKFRTSLSASTFVPNDKVKAVELAQQGDPPIKVSKSKRERLLTLPRMQRENPPTHLIRSRNGDYIRGRLIAMDDKTLKVELRLEPREIPRDRLALIVWLHPEEVKPSANSSAPTSPAAGTRVQAVCNDGVRLTFLAERLAGDALYGTSDVLGACQVRLKEIDQILIGAGIEKAAAGLVYQQWKLQNALEPKAAQGGSGESSSGRLAGMDSALVGKPAPDFEIELLDGTKFRPSRNKGKIVILDFWATWCGPCLQAMPQVEKVAGEFRDRDVQLVAVNLQEEPKQISAMLERHNLHPAVALDRDGAVAEKYAATAIPQTVIIDRDGTIARLFVGGGPHLDDQLREALRAVLKIPAPAQSVK